jgi:hypothetical protein
MPPATTDTHGRIDVESATLRAHSELAGTRTQDAHSAALRRQLQLTNRTDKPSFRLFS